MVRKLVRKMEILETGLEVISAALAIQHIPDEELGPVFSALIHILIFLFTY